MNESGDESMDRPKPVGCSSISGKHSAMQVTTLNRIAVIAWVKRKGGLARISRDGVGVWKCGSRLRNAYIGDWIVYLDAEFVVIPDPSFSQSFRLIDGPAPRMRRKVSA